MNNQFEALFKKLNESSESSESSEGKQPLETNLTYMDMQKMSREELLQTMSSFRKKQPWQLKLVNYRDSLAKRFQSDSSEYDRGYIKPINQIDAAHKKAVRQALFKGKPVPPEVLAGYPDLVKAEEEQG